MLTLIASMEQELAGLRRELRKLGLAPGNEKSPSPLMCSTEHVAPSPPSPLPVGEALRLRSGQGWPRRSRGRGEGFPSPAELHVVGIGGAQAGARLRSLLARRPEAPAESTDQLLLLGFCGAVDPSLATGDLVLATRYYRAAQGDWIEADPEMRRAALAAAAGAGLRPGQGDSLTVDHLVATPEEKLALHGAYPVGAVNMEDYWLAAAARDASVPFLSARVVLDPSTQRLPGYLIEMSRSRLRAALSAGAMPWRVPTLVGLARQMRVAQQVLARFALGFLECQQSAIGSQRLAAGR